MCPHINKTEIPMSIYCLLIFLDLNVKLNVKLKLNQNLNVRMKMTSQIVHYLMDMVECFLHLTSSSLHRLIFLHNFDKLLRNIFLKFTHLTNISSVRSVHSSHLPGMVLFLAWGCAVQVAVNSASALQ